MKVFLSWSGSRSKSVAETLAGWLPQVVQSIEPWISSDIEKGARWSQEIAVQLENTRIGIICLTQDNLTAPWILFESGAISKTKDTYVCTFLLDIKPASVEPPLGQFQHTSFEKADVYRLMQTINKAVAAAGERPLSDSQLESAFDVWWPKLEGALNGIASSPGSKRPASRPDRALLEEILEVVRGIQRPTTNPASEESPVLEEHVYQVTVPDSANWDDDARSALLVKILKRLKTVIRATCSAVGDDFKAKIWTRSPAFTTIKVTTSRAEPTAIVKKLSRTASADNKSTT